MEAKSVHAFDGLFGSSIDGLNSEPFAETWAAAIFIIVVVTDFHILEHADGVIGEDGKRSR